MNQQQLATFNRSMDMVRHRNVSKPSLAQQQASLNNNCLRTLAALEKAFTLAGHVALATRIKQLEETFRANLKEK